MLENIESSSIFLGTFAFIFGAVFGSFLNVCVHRLPKGESIVKPASHCPQCSKPIAWFDNIPLWSFLALRGKCRHCGTKIAFRYFLIEFFAGAAWLWLFHLYGPSPFFLTGIILFSILLAVTATDFETGYIPDKLTLPGMGAGLLLSALFPMLHGETVWVWSLLRSFSSLIGGGGVLLIIGLLGNFFFKKESMGGGDIKLVAMMGAFLGPEKTMLVFLFGPLLAVPFALYTKFAKHADTIPFGPFLALSGAILYVYGDWIGKNLFYF